MNASGGMRVTSATLPRYSSTMNDTSEINYFTPPTLISGMSTGASVFGSQWVAVRVPPGIHDQRDGLGTAIASGDFPIRAPLGEIRVREALFRDDDQRAMFGDDRVLRSPTI
jgi:hypothetical protein